MITLVVMTHGRLNYLEQTIESINNNLVGRVDRRIIYSDSPDDGFNNKINNFGYEVIVNSGEHGFGNAIRNMWANVTDDYIVHWEDDFTLNEKVNTDILAWVLRTSPELAQVALKRQPWNEEEHAAGGIVECDPDSYREIKRCGYTITQHDKFFTTNPCMYSKDTQALGWPEGEHSEGMFTFKMRDNELYSSFFGRKYSTPLVHHIGYDRAGGINY